MIYKNLSAGTVIEMKAYETEQGTLRLTGADDNGDYLIINLTNMEDDELWGTSRWRDVVCDVRISRQ